MAVNRKRGQKHRGKEQCLYLFADFHLRARVFVYLLQSFRELLLKLSEGLKPKQALHECTEQRITCEFIPGIPLLNSLQDFLKQALSLSIAIDEINDQQVAQHLDLQQLDL